MWWRHSQGCATLLSLFLGFLEIYHARRVPGSSGDWLAFSEFAFLGVALGGVHWLDRLGRPGVCITHVGEWEGVFLLNYIAGPFFNDTNGLGLVGLGNTII